MSYFEWVQNIQNQQWTEDEVNLKLRNKIQKAVHSALEREAAMRQAHPDDPHASLLRTAALTLAIERVSCATLERGVWP
ncbi:hypothetical protein [endosymbiont of unidentified scaly snail isolate Monju]|uniref:hypothetical protein n=1 Tax=endosymbiont of unidentified scaly snail isolate Monju TaxID=1248727 RepID=UPI00068D0C03